MSSKTIKDNKRKYREEASAGIILSVIAAGIIPLIMRTYTYDSHLSDYQWFSTDGTVVDIFLAAKSFVIIAVGILMAIVLIYKAANYDKLPKSRLFIVMAAYGAMVLISGLASKWKGFAFGGSYEMFESVLVVLCYLMFAYYTCAVTENRTTLLAFLKWTGIFVLVLMLIGVFQGFGADLFATKFGKVLFSGPSYWSNLDSLVIRMPKGTSYSTLYNPNFFSLYLGLILPVSVASFFAIKKRTARILSAALAACSVILLFTDISITGVMCLVISGIITLLVVLSRKRKLFIAACSALAAVILVGIILSLTVSPVKSLAQRMLTADPTPLTAGTLKDIETNKNDVTLDMKDGSKCRIVFSFDNSGQLNVTAEGDDGSKYDCQWDGSAVQINDGDENLASVVPKNTEDGTPYVAINTSGREFWFIQTEEGYRYITGAGKVVKLNNHIRTAGLFPEDFFSNRGIIWNRTIPLLSRHILIGSGSNTFLMDYPQDNYIMKDLLIESETTSVDVKPHNLFLQQWVENGLLALIFYLVVVIGYMVQAAGLIRKNDIKEPLVIISIGIFAGICAHTAAGIANDSNVCTSPVMWILLGLGFAVNNLIRKAQKS